MSNSWRAVADAARTTVNMEEGTKEPSSKWKKQLLLSEHSPIRLITVNQVLKSIPAWVSVHLTRHKFGVEHFVSTRREDRTGKPREDNPDVDHRLVANQQAIINISRKRLCMKASQETRIAWIDYLGGLADEHPELFSVCVPECVYRGFCPEQKTCGFAATRLYRERLIEYRKLESS